MARDRTPTQIDHLIDTDPPRPGAERYNHVSDAVCNTCGVKDSFAATGTLGADITVRLDCGHDVLWRII